MKIYLLRSFYQNLWIKSIQLFVEWLFDAKCFYFSTKIRPKPTTIKKCFVFIFFRNEYTRRNQPLAGVLIKLYETFSVSLSSKSSLNLICLITIWYSLHLKSWVNFDIYIFYYIRPNDVHEGKLLSNIRNWNSTKIHC